MSYTEKYNPLWEDKTDINKFKNAVLSDAFIDDELVINSPEQLAWLLMIDWDGEVIPATLLNMTLKFFNLESIDQLINRSADLFGPVFLAELSDEMIRPANKPFRIGVTQYQKMISDIENEVEKITPISASEWDELQRRNEKS